MSSGAYELDHEIFCYEPNSAIVL